ncbi:MAG: S8 family serine peptidase [Chloroflexota bacterium]|nr:S8 family serine peptidase [Chloroflexota bacterium]
MDEHATCRPARFLASLAVALAAISLAALATWAGGVPLAAAQARVDPAAAAAPAPRFQAGELLVRFRTGVAVASAQDVLSAHGLRQVDEIPALGVRRVRVPAGQEEALAAALRLDTRVDYAELNGILTVQETPNDPYFVSGSQWGMTRIGAPAAWDQVTGTYPITIAVVDTGVWGSHPDLLAKMVDGWYHYTESGTIFDGPIPAGTPHDPYGHGTHVAGIAAASTNNGLGVAGVSWGAPIMPFRSQASNGNGSDYDVATGIAWVTDHGAKVINISLGGPTYVQTLADAVAYAWQHGALVVAAAGNSAYVSPTYPAAYPFALGVAATDINESPGYGFAHGPWVDVAAPGVGVLSTLPSCSKALYMCSDSRYGQASGTSMATPHASGLAALIWSANPALTNAQVTYILTSTAEKVGPVGYVNGWNEYLGYGRINAAAAISATPRFYHLYLPLWLNNWP